MDRVILRFDIKFLIALFPKRIGLDLHWGIVLEWLPLDFALNNFGFHVFVLFLALHYIIPHLEQNISKNDVFAQKIS